MAHTGQELGLQPVGFFYMVVSQFQFPVGSRQLCLELFVYLPNRILRPLLLADVTDNGQHPAIVRAGHRTQADLHRKSGPVFALPV